MSIIGNNIKKIRSAKGLNQTEFGKLFNLTRGSIGSYEEGRAEPKIDTLKQIANNFSISLDAIISEELTVNQLSGLDLDALHSSNRKANFLVGLSSVLPDSLIKSKGDIERLSNNTFFKTSLINKAEFSIPLDENIQLIGVKANKGDIIFCTKNLVKSTFGYLVLMNSQLIWQIDEPNQTDGIIFTVTGLISTNFQSEKKQLADNKLEELELRISNIESKIKAKL